jgi:hypothetical protein
MFDDPWRAIAKAARLRDWATIDAVLEDKRLAGSTSVRRGFSDARKALGQEPTLPTLPAPEPVTIHDLPSREGLIIEGKPDTTEARVWRRKAA